jgi:flagellar basal body rod protein FlgB
VEEKPSSLWTGDRLNIDEEMAHLARNNILYETSTRLLSKKFQALKAAIEEGRK